MLLSWESGVCAEAASASLTNNRLERCTSGKISRDNPVFNLEWGVGPYLRRSAACVKEPFRASHKQMCRSMPRLAKKTISDGKRIDAENGKDL